MADNSFRSYGSREAAARDEFDPNAPESAGDPLAELARLIGQSDNYGRQERHSVAHASAESAEPGLDWAADADDDYAADPDYAAQPQYPAQHTPAADRYYAPPPEHPRVDLAPHHGYAEEPPAQPPPPARFFSGPAATFNGFRPDPELPRAAYAADAHASFGAEQPAPPVAPSRPQSMAPAAYDSQGQADNQAYAPNQGYGPDDSQDYAGQEYYDDEAAPPRRGGFVVVIAVLALAVLGTAGAFGYRAMFGGSVLSSLPPIIKANNGPNKITPTYGDATPSSPDQGTPGSPPREQLGPPAEQPLDVQPAVKIAPRVISTIPISGGTPGVAPAGQMTAAPGTQVAAAPFAPAPAGPAPAVPAPVVAPAPPPAVAAPATTPAVAPEPKRVHTVAIHADQQGGRAAAAPSAPPVATRRPSASRPNEPLSIVPGAGGEAPAAPLETHARAERSAMASPAAAPPTSGGYAVQVTSQRSEAEAHSAFRALKAKFPSQLGSREPIIHRADLGAKGTYYRALVGPFASAEAAAEMCSSLKAAGGNCLVQRT